MSELADQLAADVARQLRVGIEREHVADRGEQLARRADHRERRLPIAEQQSVQLLELAALALPAHEALLFGVVLAPAMQQPETWAVPAVALVQGPDAVLGE